MSDWLDDDRHDDAPRSREESKTVRVLNTIATIIFVPVLFAVWVWCGIEGSLQSTPTAALSTAPAAPYMSIMIFACIGLFPLAIAALLLRGRK